VCVCVCVCFVVNVCVVAQVALVCSCINLACISGSRSFVVKVVDVRVLFAGLANFVQLLLRHFL